MTRKPYRNTTYLVIIILGCLFAAGCKKESIPMVITSPNTMVQEFYTANKRTLFWLESRKSIKKANEWLAILDSANHYGINAEFAQIAQVRTSLLQKKKSVLQIDETDQQMTSMVLNFIKELQEGNVQFDYDGVRVSRDSVYVNLLLNASKSESPQKMVAHLDCKHNDYQVLQKFLNDSVTTIDTLKNSLVIKAMNYQRYIAVNGNSEYIVVNIPEMVARYYKNNSLNLEMRSVAGRRNSQTPTIASHIKTIVTFPHWNVPYSITVKEMLPKVQKDEIYLEQNNLTVVDAKGVEVDELDLNWMEYTERNFPYFLRQSTGAKNALGVLKFDFENPYSIYMHSTNSQSGFLRDDRFLSHGCIRLEKPIDLAMGLLRGNLDIEALKIGKKDTKSEMIELPQKVPVFIIYSPVSVVENKVTFLPDVYGLFQ